MFDIRAREVQFYCRNPLVLGKPFAHLGELIYGICRDRDEDGYSHIVVVKAFEEALQAGILEANRVDHTGWSFGESGRRVADTWKVGDRLREHRSVGVYCLTKRLFGERAGSRDERRSKLDTAEVYLKVHGRIRSATGYHARVSAGKTGPSVQALAYVRAPNLQTGIAQPKQEPFAHAIRSRSASCAETLPAEAMRTASNISVGPLA